MLPFTLLAACSKYETAHETRSLQVEGSWEGAFTAALITLLQNVPWHNLSYATLCKSLPKLPYQKPECVGQCNRIVFTLERAEDDCLYFDIEPTGDGMYTVKDAGLTLGIGAGTRFKIRGPEAQDLGALIVESGEDVKASQCCAKAELSENHQGSIPQGAKALLHHWCLGNEPLRVALDAGIERPDVPASVEIVDRHSNPDLVVVENGDNLVLDRQRPQFIVTTTNVRRLELPGRAGKVALESVLTRVARFHYHLLRKGPGNLAGMITLELCRVKQGSDGRHHKSEWDPKPGASVMDIELDLPFDPEARYGMVITNHSKHKLYPYLFYFDPSEYSIRVRIFTKYGHFTSVLIFFRSDSRCIHPNATAVRH
jgi:hypothetical protein